MNPNNKQIRNPAGATAKTLAVLIPAFNEQGAIVSTVRKVRETLLELSDFAAEIIVIDDGSTDGTSKALREVLDTAGTHAVAVTVLTHELNAGYGAALRTGLQNSSQEWIAIVDADGTYPIEMLPKLVRTAYEGHDMVVGARQGAGISSAPFRRMARAILRRLVHALTNVHVPDLNSGMRVFRRVLFDQFQHLLPSGFSFTSTITVASLYRGFSVKYVTIPYFHRQGKSHIKPYRDFLNFVMLIVRIASYFEPLRFFFPVAIFLGALAGVKGLRDLIVLGRIGSLAVMVGLTGIQVFFAGILADVMVRHFSSVAVRPVLRQTRLRPQQSVISTELETQAPGRASRAV